MSYPSCTSRLACLWTVIAGMLLGAPQTTLADPGDTEYQLAREMFKSERWDLATDRFRSFLKEFPQHRFAANARLSLALSLVYQNEYRSARSEFERFIKDYPTSRNIPDARYRLAECSYLTNDFVAAETGFETFLKLAPKHDLVEWALPYLGDTQLRLGKPQEAARSFESALEQHPEGRMSDDARYGLARAYDSLGRTTEAFEIYQRLVSNTEGRLRPQAQLRIGLSWFNRGKYTEAAQEFDKLVEAYPDDRLVPLAWMNAGYAYFQQQKYRESTERFAKVGYRGERGDTTSYWSARSYLELDEPQQALQLLKEARTNYPQSTLTEQLEYLYGLSLFRTGQLEEAMPQLIKVADRWPRGGNADDSLHYATECAMLLSRWDEAGQLVARFNATFANSPLKERQSVLGYRLQLREDDPATIEQATQALRRSLSDGRDAEARELARVYLALALQNQSQHEEVITLLKPLTAPEKSVAEAGTAIVMQASSQLALGNYQQAIDDATRYLDDAPEGPQANQALSVRVMASARLGKIDAAETELETLEQRAGRTQSTLQARLEVAEQVYGRQNWTKAVRLFEPVAAEASAASLKQRAFSGLAWSQYQQGNYEQALRYFQSVTETPADPALVPESVFMQARCLEESGRTEEAMQAYRTTLETYAPESPMKPDAELTGAPRRAYEAGKALARLTADSVDPTAADGIFERVATLFPNASDRDGLLERWAFVNVESQNYQRADEIFERLLKEFPKGPRADNARYQLAESKLVNGGSLDQAQQTFDSLQQDPQVASAVQQAALTQLVRIAVESRDWPLAERLTTDALQRFPESPYRAEIELHQAETAINRQQPTEARAFLTALRQKLVDQLANGDSVAMRAELLWSELLLGEKDYEALDKHVAAFREQHPGVDVATEMQDVMGRAWKNRAEFAKARAALQEVVDHPRLGRMPIAASSQFMIAETWFFEKQHKKALDAYLVVKIKFKSLPVWQQRAMYQIGQCDEALQNWDKAAESYRELIKDYPESELATQARKRLQALESRLARGN